MLKANEKMPGVATHTGIIQSAAEMIDKGKKNEEEEDENEESDHEEGEGKQNT